MKEIYQNMNAQIQPDEILIQKVMNQTVRKKSHIGCRQSIRHDPRKREFP